MASVHRIKGAGGVVIDSTTFLELPKAPTKTTSGVQREGMIRFNQGWGSFEGVVTFDDASIAYRRFAMLDNNGRLLPSQLPESITSGLLYVGTYSPLSDDIDPPMTPGVYTPLPAPSASVAKDYYIVRGIQNAAITHLAANPASTSTVTFTPVNPSGEGDWMEIKYYVGDNPMIPGTQMVLAAFGRLIASSIPSSHAGLTSLAQDSALTNAFGPGTDPSAETGLTDSDWIIMTDTRAQHIRSTRASILASAVLYESSVINGSGRGLQSSAGTVQTIIDTALLDGLRRTGDSMLNAGTVGKGRFGITPGSNTEPGLAFNGTAYDPVLNPGNDPSKWSDTGTGIFSATFGSVNFTANGAEVGSFSTDGLEVIVQSSNNSTTNPALQIKNGTNTSTVGLNSTGNNLDIVSNGVTQMSITPGTVIANYNAQVQGTFVVQGNSSFSSSVNTFNGITVNDSKVLTFAGTNPTQIMQAASDFQFNMTNFSDFTIFDGAAIRTRINRYGVQLPVLNPIDNSVGVDGMIAYSSQRNTVMQKSNGQWTTVSGGGVEQAFTAASWVLDGTGNFYTYTITGTNIQNVQVQESVGANFSPVEVDSVVISPTNAVLNIPAGTPDLRFAGRVIITYR